MGELRWDMEGLERDIKGSGGTWRIVSGMSGALVEHGGTQVGCGGTCMRFEGLQWDVGWWTSTQVGYGDIRAPLNPLFSSVAEPRHLHVPHQQRARH